jgi:hypothetical protein
MSYKNKQLRIVSSQALVAHTCNPSYSGGRDQQDHGLKPAQGNSSWDPISKNPSQKRAGGVAQGVGLSSSPSITHTKKSQFSKGLFEKSKIKSSLIVQAQGFHMADPFLASVGVRLGHCLQAPAQATLSSLFWDKYTEHCWSQQQPSSH